MQPLRSLGSALRRAGCALLIALTATLALTVSTPPASAAPIPDPGSTYVNDWVAAWCDANVSDPVLCKERALRTPGRLIGACAEIAGQSKTPWELQAVGGCLSSILIPENLNIAERACPAAAHPQQRNGCMFVWAIARHNALDFRPGGIWFKDWDLVSTSPEPEYGHYPDPSAAPPATPPASGAPAPPGPGGAATPTPQPTETKKSKEEELCDQMPAGTKDACRDAIGMPSGGDALNFAKDPLGSIADSSVEAAGWLIGKVGLETTGPTKADFSNGGFAKQYAITFAGATFLTMLLWISAVIKRAVRGAPFFTAIGEAVGYLWLAVMASAFTPLVLFMLVKVVDDLTVGLTTGAGDAFVQFQQNFQKGVEAPGGGPIMVIFISFLALIAAMLLWIELLLRAAMLYVGGVLATVVYAGLVDRALWPHVRRWVGVMTAVLLSKPIIAIILALSFRIGQDPQTDPVTAAIQSITILYLALFAGVMIYRFLPGWGDDLAALYYGRRQGSYQAKQTFGGLAGGRSPASLMRSGISTHAGRQGSSGGGSTTTTITVDRPSIGGETSKGVNLGVAAHGRGGGGGGGGGGMPSGLTPAASAAPAVPPSLPPSGGWVAPRPPAPRTETSSGSAAPSAPATRIPAPPPSPAPSPAPGSDARPPWLGNGTRRSDERGGA
jgi:hypothetical protein